LTEITESVGKIGFDKNKANSSLHKIVVNNYVEVENVIASCKMVKNETEAQGMRDANTRDCAAIMKYFAFLEEELAKPNHGLDEFKGVEKVESYRAMSELFRQPSFKTISSIGPNGAVIHYKPNAETALKLNNDEIYLLDSGGQYLDGTTDITRTAHFGGKEPTAFQREMYTRVLLGNLGIERVVWPESTPLTGGMIDILAR
jgi:Xaa-Pro aminopeptidase